MKKMISIMALALPFVVMGEEQCTDGLDECKFTTSIVYTIKDENGNAVETTTYENNIAMTYDQAVALKYLHFGAGRTAYLKVNEAGGLIKALKD